MDTGQSSHPSEISAVCAVGCVLQCLKCLHSLLWGVGLVPVAVQVTGVKDCSFGRWPRGFSASVGRHQSVLLLSVPFCLLWWPVLVAVGYVRPPWKRLQASDVQSLLNPQVLVIPLVARPEPGCDLTGALGLSAQV